jgi:hypothetical protein
MRSSTPWIWRDWGFLQHNSIMRFSYAAGVPVAKTRRRM